MQALPFAPSKDHSLVLACLRACARWCPCPAHAYAQCSALCVALPCVVCSCDFTFVLPWMVAPNPHGRRCLLPSSHVRRCYGATVKGNPFRVAGPRPLGARCGLCLPTSRALLRSPSPAAPRDALAFTPGDRLSSRERAALSLMGAGDFTPGDRCGGHMVRGLSDPSPHLGPLSLPLQVTAALPQHRRQRLDLGTGVAPRLNQGSGGRPPSGPGGGGVVRLFSGTRKIPKTIKPSVTSRLHSPSG